MVHRLWRNIRKFKKTKFQKPLILLYHSVAEVNTDPWSLVVTPRHFAEQLEVLNDNYRVIRLQELARDYLNGKIAGRSIAITFDDGYANNHYNAKPLLEKFEMPATIFLTSKYIGKDHEFWWDELDRILLQSSLLPESLNISINGRTYNWDLNEEFDNGVEKNLIQPFWRAWEDSTTPRQIVYLKLWELIKTLRYEQQLSVLTYLRNWANLPQQCRNTHRTLSCDEAIKLGEGGLVEIGCHTKTHPVLSAISEESQRDEIVNSKNDLQELIGRQIISFAYPYGTESDYTDSTVSIVRDAGFEFACSNISRFSTKDRDLFQLPRSTVEDWNGEEFDKRLSLWFED